MRIKVYSFASDNSDGTQVFTFATREQRAEYMLENHVKGWVASHLEDIWFGLEDDDEVSEREEPLVTLPPPNATAEQIEEAFFECLNNSLCGNCETFAVEEFIIENPEIVKETDS